jgi:hypothetical protein
LDEPIIDQDLSTIISLEWSNGGFVSQTRQPRWSICQSWAIEAHCTSLRLFFSGRKMLTTTPRIAATLRAVISGCSGRK